MNGFKKAGITEDLEKGLPEADAELDLQDLSEMIHFPQIVTKST